MGVLASSSHLTPSTPNAKQRRGRRRTKTFRSVSTTEHRFRWTCVMCVGWLTSTHTTQCECQGQLGPREVTLYLHNNEEGGIGGLWEQEKIMFSFFHHDDRTLTPDTHRPLPSSPHTEHTEHSIVFRYVLHSSIVANAELGCLRTPTAAPSSACIVMSRILRPPSSVCSSVVCVVPAAVQLPSGRREGQVRSASERP